MRCVFFDVGTERLLSFRKASGFKGLNSIHEDRFHSLVLLRNSRFNDMTSFIALDLAKNVPGINPTCEGSLYKASGFNMYENRIIELKADILNVLFKIIKHF